MSILCVHLFGKFSVRRQEEALAGFEPRKVQELFCYLILNRRQPHPRETLAGILWGDNPTSQSKKWLRQTLWQLQTAFESGPIAAKDVLLVEPDWVQFNGQADMELDIARFEQAFASVQGVRGFKLSPEQFTGLCQTVELYQGDLLAGWYQDWCLYERERLQNMYLALLDKLIGYCEKHSQYEKGLDYGGRVLRIDRARERTHRRMMRLHYLAGNRTGALRQYQACADALQQELGVAPSASTREIFRQIQADAQLTVPDASSPDAAKGATHSPLEAILSDLRELEATLGALQHQVHENIEHVETSLKHTD